MNTMTGSVNYGDRQDNGRKKRPDTQEDLCIVRSWSTFVYSTMCRICTTKTWKQRLYWLQKITTRSPRTLPSNIIHGILTRFWGDLWSEVISTQIAASYVVVGIVRGGVQFVWNTTLSESEVNCFSVVISTQISVSCGCMNGLRRSTQQTKQHQIWWRLLWLFDRYNKLIASSVVHNHLSKSTHTHLICILIYSTSPT